MVDIGSTVRARASFLDGAYMPASQLIADPADASLNDWLQASWELLVECQLPAGAFLHPYGGGADCKGESPRVSKPGVAATHVIVCHVFELRSVRFALRRVGSLDQV
jgi:hypothetical protein